jgi:hypothetical protein
MSYSTIALSSPWKIHVLQSQQNYRDSRRDNKNNNIVNKWKTNEAILLPSEAHVLEKTQENLL